MIFKYNFSNIITIIIDLTLSFLLYVSLSISLSFFLKSNSIEIPNSQILSFFNHAGENVAILINHFKLLSFLDYELIKNFNKNKS